MMSRQRCVPGMAALTDGRIYTDVTDRGRGQEGA